MASGEARDRQRTAEFLLVQQEFAFVVGTRAWARNSGSATDYDAEAVSSPFTIAAAPPINLTALSANKTFPLDSAVIVNWTATATGGVGPLQYQFVSTDANNGTRIFCSYSPSSTCTWPPLMASTYTVQVYVRSAGSTAAYEATRSQTGLVVTGAGATPISLTANQVFPVAVGTPVTWTARFAGGAEPMLYQFLWRASATDPWTITQPYSASTTWTWTPTTVQSAPGLAVWAKPASFVGDYASYIQTAAGTVSVTSGALGSVGLTVSQPSPIPTQTPITFTATVTGGTAALEYEWWVRNADTGLWTLAQPYGPLRSFTLTPPRTGFGAYQVTVWVRAQGSPADWDGWANTGWVAATP